jgi:ATP-dependent RNA helicase RhlE
VSFADLRLAEPILRSLAQERYQTPTPIQREAIPHVLAGRDLLGCAQTGTGKTAAFALPILQRLTDKPHGHHRNGAASRKVRCLILAPTRELALQIDESFRVYGRHLKLKHAVVFGGVSQQEQAHAISRGVDVLVATPGRLLDLVNQRLVDLSSVEIFVLDEADRMLDMGFIHDIRKLVALLPKHGRQDLMFSATMPPDIRALAGTILHRPANVEVTPAASTVEKVDQSVYFVERENKPQLLAHLIRNTAISRALVFTRTKHGADRVVRQLFRAGIRAEAIHGNKTQGARQRALTNFKTGRTPILIASDIAARGIDVDDISHVFNYDLTHEPETYVHRIGRTARAGAEGCAISFCNVEERPNLVAIERLIRQKIRVNQDQPKYEAVDHEHRGARSHSQRRTNHAPRAHQAHSAPLAASHISNRERPRSATPQATARPRSNGHPRNSIGSKRPSHPARRPHPLDRRARGKYTFGYAKH